MKTLKRLFVMIAILAITVGTTMANNPNDKHIRKIPNKRSSHTTVLKVKDDKVNDFKKKSDKRKHEFQQKKKNLKTKKSKK